MNRIRALKGVSDPLWQHAVSSQEHSHPSVLWCCCVEGKKGIRPVKSTETTIPERLKNRVSIDQQYHDEQCLRYK